MQLLSDSEFGKEPNSMLHQDVAAGKFRPAGRLIFYLLLWPSTKCFLSMGLQLRYWWFGKGVRQCTTEVTGNISIVQCVQ